HALGRRLSFWYGLQPREIDGLICIGTSPFLHSGWSHLLSNTPPFLSLTGLLIFFYPRLWPRVLTSLWLVTGALVWLLARPSTHIGASGVIFALAAFLGFSGFFRRDFRAIVVSLLVLFYYGGMVTGVLPGQEGISWESHLFGFLWGIGSAYLFRNELEDHEILARQKAAQRHAEQPAESAFLDPNTFQETKQERQERAFWEKIQEAARKRE
ncbi:MAG: rhomboid family intramembrane serine protease, partial [Bacteroidota bacterium]